MAVHYYLKNLQQDKFLAGAGRWTVDCSRALEFPHTCTALLKGLDFQEPTEVVLCMGTPEASLYIVTRPTGEDPHFCDHCPHHAAS